MTKKLLFGIGTVVVVVVGGIYGGYVFLQNRVAGDVGTVLSYLSPSGKVSYETLSYSIFSNEMILSGVVFEGADPMTVERLVIQKPDRDNIRTIFNTASYAGETRNREMLPLADVMIIEGVKRQRIGPYEVSLGRVVIDKPMARQFDLIPGADDASFDISRLSGQNGAALMNFASALQVEAMTLEGIGIKSTREARSEDGLWDIPLLMHGHAYMVGIDKVVFGGMDENVLKSLVMSGLSVDAEKKGHIVLKDQKTNKEKFAAKLEEISFNTVDLKSLHFFLLSEWLADEPPAALLDIAIGRFELVGLSIVLDSVRLPNEWETEGASDEVNGDGEQDPTLRKELVEITLKSFLLNDLGKGRLGALQIESFDFKDTVRPERYFDSNTRYQQGLVMIEDLDIGQVLAPYLAAIQGSSGMARNATFDQYFTPVQPGKLVVQEIRFEEKEFGVLALEQMIGSSTYRDDFMTASEIEFNGFEWEFPAEKDSNGLHSEFRNIGYEGLSLSGRGEENFVPDNGDYSLNFEIVGKNMGVVALDLALGKYPRKQRGEMHLRDVSEREVRQRMGKVLRNIEFRSAELSYQDHSLTERILEMLAESRGMSVDDIRGETMNLLLSLLEGIQQSAGGDVPTVQAAIDGLSRFIVKPGTITLRAKPENPVLLGEIEPYLYEKTPENLLAFLNFSVVSTTEGDVP